MYIHETSTTITIMQIPTSPTPWFLVNLIFLLSESSQALHTFSCYEHSCRSFCMEMNCVFFLKKLQETEWLAHMIVVHFSYFRIYQSLLCGVNILFYSLPAIYIWKSYVLYILAIICYGWNFSLLFI